MSDLKMSEVFKELTAYMKKPDVYAQSTGMFWDDEHISKGMLAAHLNPQNDAATRNSEFVMASLQWITGMFPPEKYPKLLDLGCGPGIYCEKFYQMGYEVTGIDFSKRSIDYAKNSAQEKGFAIDYHYKNYLEMDYDGEFDLITLIWCDFGVLPDEDRTVLLKKAYKALKPGGAMVFDAFSAEEVSGRKERTAYSHHPQGGFWSPKAHICLEALYNYEGYVSAMQYIILEEDKINCYRVWEHGFTKEEMEKNLKEAGFYNAVFYENVKGDPYKKEGSTLCAVAEKK